ncbi:F-box/kelch-repeat protein At5g26960 [Humulus lupulus]|uniref:F-box/kelch-repeat protein At5g26960 n=1 Tax=Humulus lupulus TaxID=3486 RepID=UPI002B407BBD|nr:F-box/kelch-repeat protein At5g26960 [Humulus lupulus]
MSESCNSRHFSWLMKSCFPNPNDNSTTVVSAVAPKSSSSFSNNCLSSTISSLPDDILLDCLSRVPPSSIPNLSLVCRRWTRLLLSPIFSDLRRHHGLLRHTLVALSTTDAALFAATWRFEHDQNNDNDSESPWKVSAFLSDDVVSIVGNQGFPSHARLSAVGPRIFIVGRNATLRYDTWTGTISARSPMMISRKKFAVATVSGKIYVAGGGSRTTAVEEYDPEEDKWCVVATAPRSRYGCIGASVDGVFYVIGGLKLGVSGNDHLRPTSGEAHVYASSMDLYDVEARAWLRSRAVPGGGCVVAACAAAGHIYVLASHAVELSFWRFNARRKVVGGSGSAFGEWCRIKSPPLPAQIRVDSTVRFGCVGVGDQVVLVQVSGCIDDLLRRSGRGGRGLKEGLVLVYDTVAGEWRRVADLPEIIQRASCVCVEC